MPSTSIPEIHAVQWVPGAGNERRDWSALYRRIDDLGKGQLRGGPIPAFERACEDLKAGHLFWTVGGSSRDEIERCVDEEGQVRDGASDLLRRTRAQIAREAGLEPVLDALLAR